MHSLPTSSLPLRTATHPSPSAWTSPHNGRARRRRPIASPSPTSPSVPLRYVNARPTAVPAVRRGGDHGVAARRGGVRRSGEFFGGPAEEKGRFGNDPVSYQGYGSRLGVEKGAVLDWGDYFYLEVFPEGRRVLEKWPGSCRDATEEYSNQVLSLCTTLTKLLSKSLGLHEDFLLQKFGSEHVQAGIRVNYYPKCPQPDLTLGLSPHSDPGGLTVLLADDDVEGLQVRKGDKWVVVKPVANAFIVNVADQVQVISNGIYKSVEHRVTTNSTKDRLSIAFFYSPNNDVPIEPAPELVSSENPAQYTRTTYREYRLYIRKKGPSGKSQKYRMSNFVLESSDRSKLETKASEILRNFSSASRLQISDALRMNMEAHRKSHNQLDLTIVAVIRFVIRFEEETWCLDITDAVGLDSILAGLPVDKKDNHQYKAHCLIA
ncbi:uncharacterized protein A4U43_C02F2660 [Asparagus officinalis]|uniref:Fe2OG dioxygenase domain-containing protein n=1 Tax=Asparagus officinalis TaxID=4686 RepID=A0A5P1FFC0_ASPOF|nr:uncharacterized protein A4U43_C02F2660 [Asparagus officinalis]